LIKPERDKPIKYDIQLSEEQKNAKEQILTTPFSFINGAAASGKTLLATQIALDLFFKKEVKKIVICRPTVGTEDNGFLPGTIGEKLEPWLVPIRDNMRKVYNKPDKLKAMEMNEDIELVALSHFRGRSFSDAVCIIDEAQNLNKSQLRMALGRLGKGSIMIFCGDKDQIDLKNKSESAIWDIDKLKDSKYVSIINLTENHRHIAVKEVLEILK
jgi:phosphate starvation-inducible PhoH-like protein